MFWIRLVLSSIILNASITGILLSEEAELDKKSVPAVDFDVINFPNRGMLIKKMAIDIKKDFERLNRFDNKDKVKENPDNKQDTLSPQKIMELRILKENFKINYRGKTWLRCVFDTYFKGQEISSIKAELSKKLKDLDHELGLLEEYEQDIIRAITPKRHKELSILKIKIKDNFGDNIEKYVESFFSKKLNLTDRKHFYFLYLFSPDINPIRKEEYQRVNSIQLKYYDKGVRVIGVIDEASLASVDFAIPKKVRHKINSNRLVERFNVMGNSKPNFLVGIDESRTANKISSLMEQYLYISKRQGQRRKFPQSVPQVFLIDKKSKVVWTGAVKDAHYYLDRMIIGKYRWEDYLQVHKTRTNFQAYIRSENQSKSVIKKIRGTIFNQAKGDPVLLIDFARLIYSQPLYSKLRDVNFAYRCCQHAHKNNLTDPQLTVALAQAYFEKGELDQAIFHGIYAKKHGFKEVLRRQEGRIPYYFLDKWLIEWQELSKKIGKDNFKKMKISEILFTEKLWPYLSGKERKTFNSKSIRQLCDEVFEGLKFSLQGLQDILIYIGTCFEIKPDNIHARYLCQKINHFLSKSTSKRLFPYHQNLFAALSCFEFKFGDIRRSEKLMKKAISLNPKSKDCKKKYNHFLRNSIQQKINAVKENK